MARYFRNTIVVTGKYFYAYYKPNTHCHANNQYTQQQLTELLTSNNPTDLMVLYDVYSKALYNVLLTMLHDEKTAQDALCDAFVTMRKERHSYNPAVCNPFTWMLRKTIATGMLQTGDKDTVASRLKKAFIKKPAKKIDRWETAFAS